jgi:two-component system, NtrC family, sensor histidine kinase HydH
MASTRISSSSVASAPPAETPAIARSAFPVRNSDLLLAILFGALILFAHDTVQKALIFGMAILQLIEGRIPILKTPAGRMTSVFLQLVLGCVLMHQDGDIASPYYPILLLPVVSTASYLGVLATIIASVAAVAASLSFLLFIDWNHFEMDPEGPHVLTIRCLLMAATAVLVNSLGRVIRTESARNKATAEKLAIANENLREAEATVRRVERLAALGQLTAGLAHELRNPLASIKGSADLLARASGERDAVARELGDIISSEVDRTNLLVTRLLDFARPLEPRREMTNLAEVIDRAAGHASVPIVREFSRDVPQLSIDPALMEQVFINLLTNAAQASQPGDPVTVATRMKEHHVEITVTDQGSGIPPEKRETIFNPFFTTKQTGVGLGLAIVSKIVDGHRGKVTVESEPGHGSTFRICLPVEP